MAQRNSRPASPVLLPTTVVGSCPELTWERTDKAALLRGQAGW